MRKKLGLSKHDIADLEAKIPPRDPIARSQSMPTHTGRIEAIEEAFFPWLKQRRRSRREPKD